jgi:hypothetical protein
MRPARIGGPIRRFLPKTLAENPQFFYGEQDSQAYRACAVP